MDEDRYSRQIAEYGHQSMKKLNSMRVLVVGLRGLGIEISKNLILSGIGSLTIFDNDPIDFYDTSSSFCYSQSDIGKIRSLVSYNSLKILNNLVEVEKYENDLNEQFLKTFSVVIITKGDYNENIRINEICRNSSPAIGFILAQNYGVTFKGFLDFGDSFVCNDPIGEEQKEIEIASISKEENGMVTCHIAHRLDDGDYVKFNIENGMKELSNFESLRITYNDMVSFKINDTRNYNDFTFGKFKKLITPKIFNFKNYKDSCINPTINFMSPEFSKGQNIPSIHFAYLAIDRFYEKFNRLPNPLNDSDADEIFKLSTEINENSKTAGNYSAETLNKNIIENISKYSVAQISPLVTIFGGIIAQEAIKYIGKYTPLNQFIYLDYFEILGNDPIIDNSYHASQMLIIGENAHKKLSNQNIFMIGAGAVGCELIKIFASFGVKSVIVTDDDKIENSNLSRQFLFRYNDTGRNKSEVACQAGLAINNEVNFVHLPLRACSKTENYFNQQFWKNIDFVFLAVDNVEARNYIDEKCVLYEKKLLECGTEGMRGSCNVFIPHQTISYTDIKQPKREYYPLCTIKSFPYESIHCIEWAKNEFESIFNISIAEAKRFIINKEKYIDRISFSRSEEVLEKLISLHSILKILNFKNHDNIIHRIIEMHENYFKYKIINLINLFPENYETERGRFWETPKRFPVPLNFDINSETDFLFVKSTYLLFCKAFDIAPEADLKQAISSYIPSEDVENVFHHVTEVSSEKESIANSIKFIIEYLQKFDCENLNQNIQTISYEKDDNLHVDFMTAFTNLRCKNYRIEECFWFDVKIKSGNIIPALSTATCVSSGYIALELYKFMLDRELKYFKNTFYNLKEPFINKYTPEEPYEIKENENDNFIYRPEVFTKWTKIEINGPISVINFIKFVEEKLGAEIMMVFCNGMAIQFDMNDQEILNSELSVYLRSIIVNYSDNIYYLLLTAFDLVTKKVINHPKIKYISSSNN